MFATDMQTLLVFPTWDIKDFNVQPEPRVCKTLNIYTYTKLKYNIQIYIFIAKKVDQIASLKEESFFVSSLLGAVLFGLLMLW